MSLSGGRLAVHHTRTRRALTSATVITVVAVVVLLALGAWLVRSGTAEEGRSPDIFQVRLGSFDIVIPTSGELAALRQIEIKNELETRAVITEIAEEGARVRAGDILVRFNDEDIVTRIKDAQDEAKLAGNAVTTAEADVAILRQEHESKLAAASLRITLADLALRSWLEGEDKTKRQELDLAVKTAEKEHERAAARFEAAERLKAQDFISLDDFKRDEIALLRAESDLETSRLQREVYIEYDSQRLQKEKESDLEQARDEHERTKARLEAEMKSALETLDVRRAQLQSKEERLTKWQAQHEWCVLEAPTDGLVVYASSVQSGGWHRNDEDPPQVGTEVPRNKTIMILPDVSTMIAAVKVNEALSGLIKPDQRVTISPDALPDAVIGGRVLSIGVLAETGGWRDPNRRDYTVRILLEDGHSMGLKPSMACKARIAVGRVEDALHVPIQAIFREGRRSFVYLLEGAGGCVQQAVEVGRASTLYAEVVSGLEEGQRVLLREPSPAEVTRRLEPDKRPPAEERVAEADPGAGHDAGGRPELAAAEPAPGEREPRGPGAGRPPGGDRAASDRPRRGRDARRE
jgi:multidrug resistance efflux pump